MMSTTPEVYGGFPALSLTVKFRRHQNETPTIRAIVDGILLPAQKSETYQPPTNGRPGAFLCLNGKTQEINGKHDRGNGVDVTFPFSWWPKGTYVCLIRVMVPFLREGITQRKIR